MTEAIQTMERDKIVEALVSSIEAAMEELRLDRHGFIIGLEFIVKEERRDFVERRFFPEVFKACFEIMTEQPECAPLVTGPQNESAASAISLPDVSVTLPDVSIVDQSPNDVGLLVCRCAIFAVAVLAAPILMTPFAALLVDALKILKLMSGNQEKTVCGCVDSLLKVKIEICPQEMAAPVFKLDGRTSEERRHNVFVRLSPQLWNELTEEAKHIGLAEMLAVAKGLAERNAPLTKPSAVPDRRPHVSPPPEPEIHRPQSNESSRQSPSSYNPGPTLGGRSF